MIETEKKNDPFEIEKYAPSSLKPNLMEEFNEMTEKNLDKYASLFKVSMDDGLKKEFKDRFQKLGVKANPSSKYQRAEKFFPIVFYLFARQKGFLIERDSLLKEANMEMKDYKTVLKKIITLDANLGKRRRLELFVKQLNSVMIALNLNDFLKSQVKALFKRYWGELGFYSDKTVIAILIILAQIKTGTDALSITEINGKLNIRSGSVNNAIGSFLQKKGIENFRGIVKSKQKIKDILDKSGGC